MKLFNEQSEANKPENVSCSMTNSSVTNAVLIERAVSC